MWLETKVLVLIIIKVIDGSRFALYIKHHLSPQRVNILFSVEVQSWKKTFISHDTELKNIHLQQQDFYSLQTTIQ